MNIGRVIGFLLLAIGASLSVTLIAAQEGPTQESETQAAVGTAFTYQGRLKDNGQPANGVYDFYFELHDAPTGDAYISEDVVTNVSVVDGFFTVSLDFGAFFDGTAYWIDVFVKPSGTQGYQQLSPRQPLSPVPYALSAPTSSLTAPDGSPSRALAVDNNGRVGIGTTAPDHKLTVDLGAGGFDGINLLTDNNTGNLTMRFEYDDAANAAHFIYDNGSNNHAFNVRSNTDLVLKSGGDNERMRLQSSGNVQFSSAAGLQRSYQVFYAIARQDEAVGRPLGQWDMCTILSYQVGGVDNSDGDFGACRISFNDTVDDDWGNEGPITFTGANKPHWFMFLWANAETNHVRCEAVCTNIGR